jgi:exosome complex RNA-binding protein Rrp4
LKSGTIIFGLSGKEKRVEEKIEMIKKYCQFEVAFGKNDILWLSCSVPNTEMILYNIFVALLGGCSEEAFQSLLKMLHP